MNNAILPLFSCKIVSAAALATTVALTACHSEPAQPQRTSTTAGNEHQADMRARHDDEVASQRTETSATDQPGVEVRSEETAVALPTPTSTAALPTAQDQSSAPTDVEITRSIREQITANASLSVRARAATIVVTENNVVTLRGSVRSNTERDAIENAARSANGVTRVDNHLVVSR